MAKLSCQGSQGPYKYLQIEFSKQGFAICITVLTSLAKTKNAHG